MGFYFGQVFFNFIGACIRWIYGTIWRSLFNKPKFSFKEYLYGPKNSADHFDFLGHQFNNRFIGALVFGVIILLLV
ncbi:MAG: hypothetical protein COB12_06905 [Flavobacterium sp.]|nr:MAG: hypothetical protein COB12_06905 [Flavobacterium sp.]